MWVSAANVAKKHLLPPICPLLFCIQRRKRTFLPNNRAFQTLYSVVVGSSERFFRLCGGSSLTCQWQGRLEQSARVWLCFCVLSTLYFVGPSVLFFAVWHRGQVFFCGIRHATNQVFVLRFWFKLQVNALVNHLTISAFVVNNARVCFLVHPVHLQRT